MNTTIPNFTSSGKFSDTEMILFMYGLSGGYTFYDSNVKNLSQGFEFGLIRGNDFINIGNGTCYYSYTGTSLSDYASPDIFKKVSVKKDDQLAFRIKRSDSYNYNFTYIPKFQGKLFKRK